MTLDGSGSSDADGDPLTYRWSFTSKPGGSSATLSNSTSVSPAFTADKDGSYVLQLIVNDGTVDSAADTMTVIATNAAPVANAGPDQNVNTGSLVTLDGSASTDANGDLLSYFWAITSSPASTPVLTNPYDVHPDFTPNAAGTYTVQLVVNDGKTDSLVDEVTISAIDKVSVPDTGQTTDYDGTLVGEDNDYSFNAPSYTDNGDGTVKDNVTGLLWQKTDDDTTRSRSDAIAYCGGLSLGSYSDWRLPNSRELLYLVDYGKSGPNPMIDVVFVNTDQASYWTATADVMTAGKAWRVDFRYGQMLSSADTDLLLARCVRGPEQTSHLFKDNGDGTVTDLNTGLMWDLNNSFDWWENAISSCEGLDTAGRWDWRLPNIKELRSFYDYSMNPSGYWSSTSQDGTYAWMVNFYDGRIEMNSGLKTTAQFNKKNFRCVRGQ